MLLARRTVQNDLDVETLRALEDALGEFAGTAVIISHDRRFPRPHLHPHHSPPRTTASGSSTEGNYREYENNKIQRLGEEAAKPIGCSSGHSNRCCPVRGELVEPPEPVNRRVGFNHRKLIPMTCSSQFHGWVATNALCVRAGPILSCFARKVLKATSTIRLFPAVLASGGRRRNRRRVALHTVASGLMLRQLGCLLLRSSGTNR